MGDRKNLSRKKYSDMIRRSQGGTALDKQRHLFILAMTGWLQREKGIRNYYKGEVERPLLASVGNRHSHNAQT